MILAGASIWKIERKQNKNTSQNFERCSDGDYFVERTNLHAFPAFPAGGNLSHLLRAISVPPVNQSRGQTGIYIPDCGQIVHGVCIKLFG